jgi:NAD-dependent deacetylase
MPTKKHIVFLTGAGISAESGLQTFRDSDGLWNGHNVQEVATPEGFNKNPQLVLDFYNQRRDEVVKAKPNDAHKAIAALQLNYDITVITQNIDDLHERAGTTNVVHLHGEISKMCSIKNKNITYPYNAPITIGQLAPDGAQLRPFIVWFNEEVPKMDTAAQIVNNCDCLVVVGTSLQVYPAANLINMGPPFLPIVIIDKKIPATSINKSRLHSIEATATEGAKRLPNLLATILKD